MPQPRFSRMLILCAWCGRFLGTTITRAGHTGTSHGICQHCASNLMEGYQP